jgi:hypothetical protein
MNTTRMTTMICKTQPKLEDNKKKNDDYPSQTP